MYENNRAISAKCQYRDALSIPSKETRSLEFICTRNVHPYEIDFGEKFHGHLPPELFYVRKATENIFKKLFFRQCRKSWPAVFNAVSLYAAGD